MRVTSRFIPPAFVLALVTALLSTVSSGQAYAQTRSFQMAMWAENDVAPGVDTDIPVFQAGQLQPPGRSILIRSAWENVVTAEEYDWSRIVAVLVDEPYNEFNGLQSPCWSPEQVAAVNARAQALAINAAQLKSVAPRTRYWVNLAKHQLDWVMSPQCAYEELRAVNVNKPYIDVISVDIYRTEFATGVKPYYDWLDAHRATPHQQLALIPGTHHQSGDSAFTKVTLAIHLLGYFEYANEANQSCDLPVISRRRTGIFDGCRVWIVLGWLANNYTEDGVHYIGERDSRSQAIADVWQGRLALPLRPDLAHPTAPAQLLPTVLPLLLDDDLQ